MADGDAIRDETARELGLAESSPLAALSPAELAGLGDAVRDARVRQRASLDEAIAKSLKAVPWILRGAVRKVLFP